MTSIPSLLVRRKTGKSKLALTQLSVKETLQWGEPYEKDRKKQKEINAKIMQFICLDQHPLSVVDDVRLKRRVNHLDPHYVHQGRKYFTDVCLQELYQMGYEHIKSLMNNNVTSVSFTSDIWSSSVSPMSRLSLIVQFINENFEFIKVVLHSQRSCSIIGTDFFYLILYCSNWVCLIVLAHLDFILK